MIRMTSTTMSDKPPLQWSYSEGHGGSTPGKQSTPPESFTRKTPLSFNLSEDMLKDFAQLPETDIASQLANQRTMEFVKKMDQEIASSLGLPPGFIGETTDQTTTSGSSIGSALNQDAIAKRKMLDQLLYQYNKDEVIAKIIEAEGMAPTSHMIQSVKDFIRRAGNPPLYFKSNQQPDDPALSPDPDKRMDQLVEKLKKIHGVKDAQFMFDDYPELMTIIVKINMTTFTESETDAAMDSIESTIQHYRPDNLIELEVIYHNKVIY